MKTISSPEALEITTFKLKDCSLPEFIKANKEVDAFLLRQKGFRSRRMIQMNNGLIADVLIWDNAANGTMAMHQLMLELADAKVHAMIDQTTVDWNIATIKHFVNLNHEQQG